MTLVRGLHRRVAMAGVGAPWPVMGELAGVGRGGRDWGGLGSGCSMLSPCSWCLLYVREESRKEKGEEKRREKRKEEEKEKKKRKKGKNSNLKIFRKNKR
jgi:hypothetical protein